MKRSTSRLILFTSAFLFITSQACVRMTQLFSPSATATLPALNSTLPTLPPTEPPAPIIDTKATEIIPPAIVPTEVSVAPTADSPLDVTAIPEIVSGEFRLLYYPPLVMNYNTSMWVDNTQPESGDPYQTNELRANGFSTCRIIVQGAMGIPPVEHQSIQLGNVQYNQYTIVTEAGDNMALFIENSSLSGYNYEQGLPIPAIASSPAEWDICMKMGQEVISTLHIP